MQTLLLLLHCVVVETGLELNVGHYHSSGSNIGVIGVCRRGIAISALYSRYSRVLSHFSSWYSRHSQVLSHFSFWYSRYS